MDGGHTGVNIYDGSIIALRMRTPRRQGIYTLLACTCTGQLRSCMQQFMPIVCGQVHLCQIVAHSASPAASSVGKSLCIFAALARMQRQAACEALYAARSPAHARQPSCEMLPHSALAALPPVWPCRRREGQHSVQSAVAGTTNASSSAASQPLFADDSEPATRDSDAAADADSWHPFEQPTLWEGSEAEALQPQSPVLELAPPWRVRASRGRSGPAMATCPDVNLPAHLAEESAERVSKQPAACSCHSQRTPSHAAVSQPFLLPVQHLMAHCLIL